MAQGHTSVHLLTLLALDGTGVKQGTQVLDEFLQWSNEQVQILSPQKICSSGTQSTDPARSQSYIRPGWLGREKCPKKAAQGT